MRKKFSRDELVRAVRRLIQAEGTEEELDELLTLIEASVPHPQVSDLIYYPEVALTAEEIVEVALGDKPIVLLNQLMHDTGENK